MISHAARHGAFRQWLSLFLQVSPKEFGCPTQAFVPVFSVSRIEKIYLLAKTNFHCNVLLPDQLEYEKVGSGFCQVVPL